jgi:ABC-2 type transport system ATP-binding protein
MLKFSDVSKRYKNKFAVKSININIENGKVYLFVGENGSGKSTTIKLISRIIYTNEFSIFKNEYKRIMYLPDKRNYPKTLSSLDFLKYYLVNQDLKKIEEYMIKYELPNKAISSLSKGNMQKVGIIQMVLSDGDLYAFDEPTDGLDNESISLFIEDLKELVSKGKTIVISTHKKNLYSDLKPNIYKFEDGVCNEKKRKTKIN